MLAEQNQRDRSDTNRPVGPLAAAADSIEVDTDGLTRSEVVDRLEQLVRQRLGDSVGG